MGRGSNNLALEAKQLLYGPRPQGRGPSINKASLIDDLIYSLDNNRLPTFLSDGIAGLDFSRPSHCHYDDLLEDGGQVHNYHFTGLARGEYSCDLSYVRDNSKGYFSFSYEWAPSSDSSDPDHYPDFGSSGEREFIRLLANRFRDTPDLMIEFVAFTPQQLKTLIANYPVDFQLGGSTFADKNSQQERLSKLLDDLPERNGLTNDQLNLLRSHKTFQEILQNDGLETLSKLNDELTLYIEAPLAEFADRE